MRRSLNGSWQGVSHVASVREEVALKDRPVCCEYCVMMWRTAHCMLLIVSHYISESCSSFHIVYCLSYLLSTCALKSARILFYPLFISRVRALSHTHKPSWSLLVLFSPPPLHPLFFVLYAPSVMQANRK